MITSEQSAEMSRVHLETMFGDNANSDNRISLFFRGSKPGGKESFFYDDIDSALPSILTTGPMNCDTYVCVNLMRAGIEYGRGRASDVTKVCAMTVDLDVNTDTRSEYFEDQWAARKFLDDLPLTPTIVVATAGAENPQSGLHAYWVFETPLDPIAGDALTKRWWNTVKAHCDAQGVKLDKTCDLTRAPRVAGTFTTKHNTHTELVECDPNRKYSPDDFLPYLVAESDFSKRTRKCTHNPIDEAETLRIIESALAVLDESRCDDRDDWLKVGMCIYHALDGSDKGFQLWDEWSQNSYKYTSGECRYQWESFDSPCSNPVTLGTLLHIADEDYGGRDWLEDRNPFEKGIISFPLNTATQYTVVRNAQNPKKPTIHEIILPERGEVEEEVEALESAALQAHHSERTQTYCLLEAALNAMKPYRWQETESFRNIGTLLYKASGGDMMIMSLFTNWSKDRKEQQDNPYEANEYWQSLSDESESTDDTPPEEAMAALCAIADEDCAQNWRPTFRFTKKDKDAVIWRAFRHASFFFGKDSHLYATMNINRKPQTHSAYSESFASLMNYAVYRELKEPMPRQRFEDCMSVIEGELLCDEAERREVFKRFGVQEDDDSHIIDTGSVQWDAISVTASGWQKLPKHPIPFIRQTEMEALADPEENIQPQAFMNTLFEFVNVSPDDQLFVVSWLVAAMLAIPPYPILIFQGEQGSAKSFSCECLRDLIDPVGAAPTVSLPTKVDDFITLFHNNAVLAFDNISRISQEMSDLLCRASTGAGFTARKKYSDATQFVVAGSRPIMMNGIPNEAKKPDLADRALLIHTPVISMDKRKTKRELTKRWEEQKGTILGGLLSIASQVLANLEQLNIQEHFRMADFTEIIVATGQALGIQQNDVFDRLQKNVRTQAAQILDGPVPQSIIELAKKLHRNKETEKSFGKATELFTQAGLMVIPGTAQRFSDQFDWPRSANAFSRILNVLTKNLRDDAGVSIEDGTRTNKGQSKTLKIVDADLLCGDADAAGPNVQMEGVLPLVQPAGNVVAA